MSDAKSTTMTNANSKSCYSCSSTTKGLMVACSGFECPNEAFFCRGCAHKANCRWCLERDDKPFCKDCAAEHDYDIHNGFYCAQCEDEIARDAPAAKFCPCTPDDRYDANCFQELLEHGGWTICGDCGQPHCDDNQCEAHEDCDPSKKKSEKKAKMDAVECVVCKELMHPIHDEDDIEFCKDDGKTYCSDCYESHHCWACCPESGDCGHPEVEADRISYNKRVLSTADNKGKFVCVPCGAKLDGEDALFCMPEEDNCHNQDHAGQCGFVACSKPKCEAALQKCKTCGGWGTPWCLAVDGHHGCKPMMEAKDVEDNKGDINSYINCGECKAQVNVTKTLWDPARKKLLCDKCRQTTTVITCDTCAKKFKITHNIAHKVRWTTCSKCKKDDETHLAMRQKRKLAFSSSSSSSSSSSAICEASVAKTGKEEKQDVCDTTVVSLLFFKKLREGDFATERMSRSPLGPVKDLAAICSSSLGAREAWLKPLRDHPESLDAWLRVWREGQKVVAFLPDVAEMRAAAEAVGNVSLLCPDS